MADKKPTAREVELQLQQDVRDAVAKANRDELPKLGGPIPPEARVSREGEGKETIIGKAKP
jgi:hypothetical protein